MAIISHLSNGPTSVELSSTESWYFVRGYGASIKEVFDDYAGAYQWLVDNGYNVSMIPEPVEDDE